jgi:Skp family chaperone for outer membrane proteins
MAWSGIRGNWALPGLAALLWLGSPAAGAHAQTAATAPPTPVIVMVDMQQLVYSSKAGKGIQAQMEKQRQTFSKEVALQEDELQKTRAEIERQRSTLPPDQFEAKGRQFQQRLQELDRNVQAKQRAWQQVLNEAVGKVQDVALQVVAEIANERHANLVMQKAAVIVAKDGYDITDDAMLRLDQRLPAVTVNQPKPVDVSKAAEPAKPKAPGQAQAPLQSPQPQLNLQLQPAPQGQLQLQQSQ